MARGRVQWKRALDIKPRLGRLFGYLEENAAFLTRGLRYYSRTGIVREDQLYENFTRRLRLNDDGYRAAYESLSVHNVDGVFAEMPDVRMQSGLLDDYFVNGHTLYPVNRQTGIIAEAANAPLPWGITYPLPSNKSAIRLSGIFTAVPHIKNYYHLLIDFVMPVMAAIMRNPGRFSGPFTFVINTDSPLVSLMSEILREMGIDAHVLKVEPSDTVTGDQYLWAKSRAGSTEHNYAFRDELALMDDAIARRVKHIKVPKKIYIPRTATRLRNLINQNELVTALSGKGFTPIMFQWDNLPEQIAAFRNAEQIVSVHGAALSNLVWGGGGQPKIVEILPNNARKTTYLHISSQNDWKYEFSLGSDELKRQNFHANVPEVIAKLT
jgi:hypothetical protein